MVPGSKFPLQIHTTLTVLIRHSVTENMMSNATVEALVSSVFYRCTRPWWQIKINSLTAVHLTGTQPFMHSLSISVQEFHIKNLREF